MNPTTPTIDAEDAGFRFSAHATLCALGARLRQLDLLQTFHQHVHVPQKTIKHTPAEKLYDALIAILAGAHGTSGNQHPSARRRSTTTRFW